MAGQTVAPEKAPAAAGAGPDDKTYFINVARAGDSDEPFQIAVVFETPRPGKGAQNHRRSPPAAAAVRRGRQVPDRVRAQSGRRKDYRLVGDPEGFVSHIGVGLWDSRAITEAPDNPDSLVPQGQLVVRLPGRRHALFVQQSDRPARN